MKMQEILGDDYEVRNQESAFAQHRSDSEQSRLLESRQTSKFLENQSYYNTSFNHGITRHPFELAKKQN